MSNKERTTTEKAQTTTDIAGSVEEAATQPAAEQTAQCDSDTVADTAASELLTDDPANNSSEQPSVKALQEQIETLQQEVADTKDQALRTVADAQNAKRRAEKDVENARKYALEKFASEMLGVADNLERALDAADKSNDALIPLIEGVELTQKNLIDGLKKFHVEQIDPAGEPFDPQFHQAMSMVENPDVEPNTVTLVMQKGYSLNGRLLRPAMVMVAKAPASSIDETV